MLQQVSDGPLYLKVELTRFSFVLWDTVEGYVRVPPLSYIGVV